MINGSTFSGLTSLDFLGLEKNPLHTILPWTFQSVPNVTYLDLKSCRMNKTTRDMFWGLRKIEKIELNEDLIREVESLSFSDLDTLINLAMGSNNLQIITASMFKPGEC